MSPATRLVRPALIVVFLLTALASTAASDDDTWYIVHKGDYLTRIANRFGTTVAQLMRDNALTSDLIYPEQRLSISRPFSLSTPGGGVWRRPFTVKPGESLRPFGDLTNGSVTTRHSGIDMAFSRGGRVIAPAHGVIRYLGDQEGYGRLMILDHGDGYATVLGPFDVRNSYVQTGQMVTRGDGLGLTGAPVESSQPYLHIELRHDNKAVDPARLMR